MRCQRSDVRCGWLRRANILKISGGVRQHIEHVATSQYTFVSVYTFFTIRAGHMNYRRLGGGVGVICLPPMESCNVPVLEGDNRGHAPNLVSNK